MQVAKATRTPMTTDREKTIGVRVSPEEYKAIKKRSDAVGLRVAPYLRLLALQDSASIIHDNPPLQNNNKDSLADYRKKKIQ